MISVLPCAATSSREPPRDPVVYYIASNSGAREPSDVNISNGVNAHAMSDSTFVRLEFERVQRLERARPNAGSLSYDPVARSGL